MPGIVGIITRMPPEMATDQLQRMVRSMLHEPFYVSGSWADEELGLYVGWVERDGGATTRLPLRSATGEKLLFFSGEEFSGVLAGSGNSHQGNGSHSGGPTFAMSAGERDGNFLARLNGQFQGVLADRIARRLVLFNDRYGLRRVYYHEAADAFYFAAEAKAILAVCPDLREADPRGIGEYLACGCVLEDRTLFKRIGLLPPASAWRFGAGRLEAKEAYFSRQTWENQDPMAPEAYHDEVRQIFARVLPRYFAAQGGVGLSLTGGLDTRMILAWLGPEPDSLPCYTFGGIHRDSHDVRIARHVAAVCRQPHQVLLMGSEFLSDFSQYAERAVYLSDGSAGTRHAPDLYVNRLARQIAPIRMTGNYGDQVLRQLTVFRPRISDEGVFSPELVSWMEAASGTYAGALRGHPLTLASTHQTSWHYYGNLSVELSQVEMRTPYLDNELMGALYRAPASALHNNDLRVWLIRAGNPVLARIRTDLGFAGRGGRAASLVSQQLHRFTMRAEYGFEHASPRQLVNLDRTVLRGRFERAFLGRHNFTHFSLWYRGPLAEYVRGMLLDERTLSRWYVDRKRVEAAVSKHLNGEENFTSAIHKLLSLEYFHRLFIDAP